MTDCANLPAAVRGDGKPRRRGWAGVPTIDAPFVRDGCGFEVGGREEIPRHDGAPGELGGGGARPIVGVGGAVQRGLEALLGRRVTGADDGDDAVVGAVEQLEHERRADEAGAPGDHVGAGAVDVEAGVGPGGGGLVGGGDGHAGLQGWRGGSVQGPCHVRRR
jgi:hypothetical protein